MRQQVYIQQHFRRGNADSHLDCRAALIADYLFNYRPALVEDAKNPWLFPGAGESHKSLTTLSD
jgi:integrase